MKTVIYGGTFNPPHNGHTAAVKAVCDVLKPQNVIIIPAAEYRHKSKAPCFAGGEDRLAMVKLAMDGIETVTVSDCEIACGGRATVDTVKEIASARQGDELYLVLGTDMAECVDTWIGFDELKELVRFAVPSRERDGGGRARRAAEKLSALGAKVTVIPGDVIDVSSAEIRALLPDRGGREYLSDSVYSYILKNRLYGAKPDFGWLREKSYAMLRPKRIPHVMGTEEEAVRLAERWGADVDKAREAAILHDCTKKEDGAAQLILCEKYGIIIDDDERKNDKLLHSKTGAAIADAEFGLDREVCEAINWHTTGRADMTMLEKIIYLADYIEPNRDFEGLAELRRLAYEDIDRAILMGLEMSIGDITARGITPHARTLEAANWLREHIGEN